MLLTIDLAQTGAFIYREQAAGVLADPVHYAVKFDASNRFPILAIGDVNGDGCNDIVTAGAQTGWALHAGIGCGPRVLIGTTPYFGSRGSDAPRPPNATQAASHASTTDAAVWRATQSFLKGAQLHFHLSATALRTGWRWLVSRF